MKRREFLTVPVKSLGGLLLYTLAGEPVRLPAAENGKVKIPLLFFTEAEAHVVQAACARIFPTDENGPGATEANVIVYIDRQLAGPWGKDTKPSLYERSVGRVRSRAWLSGKGKSAGDLSGRYPEAGRRFRRCAGCRTGQAPSRSGEDDFLFRLLRTRILWKVCFPIRCTAATQA